MSMKKTKTSKMGKYVFGVLVYFSLLSSVSAAVMTSTNYKIQSDSINVGGGPSTSTNYKTESTAGEQATGEGTSTSYKLKAGYQTMQEAFLSLTSPANISMTALTNTQNTAVGSTVWTVATDNLAGYTLSIYASGAPALRDSGTGESFTDYGEAVSGVQETWSVGNAYEFGFSVIGSHTTGYGSDANCIAGADVPSTTLLWEGFKGTTAIVIANSTSATPSGTNTTLCVATEQNGVFAPSGSYTATTTVTAIAS